MQTKIVGGESDTVQKAEHVTPAKPRGPPVVTTVTVDANFESASRNSVTGILVLSHQRPAGAGMSGMSRTRIKFS